MISLPDFNSLTPKNMEEDIQSFQTINEFIKSVSLVIYNISSLFNKDINKLSKKMIRCQNSTQNQKQKFYSLLNLGNRELLLKELDNIILQQENKINVEFFYAIAKKIIKTQSLEIYVSFCAKLIYIYQFNSFLIRLFLTGEKDYTDIQQFLKKLQKKLIEDNYKDSDIVISSSFISILEKLAQQSNFDDFFYLLENNQQYLQNIQNDENFTKMFTTLVNSIVHKHSSHLLFAKSLYIFQQKNFKYSTEICNQILIILLRQKKSKEFFDFFINFMQEQFTVYDIDTYNCLINHNNRENEYQKSIELYQQLVINNYEPNSQTYFLLIKGSKNKNKQEVKKCLEFFYEYKNKENILSLQIYNIVLESLILNDQFEQAIKVFNLLEKEERIKPDHYTFNVLIKNACKQQNLDFGLNFLDIMEQRQIMPNKIIYNLLMNLAVKIQRMNDALKLIERMNLNHICPDSFTYSIILNGLKINNSSIQLVKLCLRNIEKVLNTKDFQQDQILYNSIFDLAFKHDLLDSIEQFYKILQQNKIEKGEVTCNILIKTYCKLNKLDKAYKIFDYMIYSKMNISDVSYGYILDACSKHKRMDLAIKIYDLLIKNQLYINSIIYTTIIKGYQKSGAYQKAIEFFDLIKDRTDLPGMLITYNCVLNIYYQMEEYEKAEQLFQIIDKQFGADLISYSTLIKGLTQNNQIQIAQNYLKKMIKSKIKIDISVINLFLESCSNRDNYKLGLNAYQFAMMYNIIPNEVTFGIMIKLYGFARELHKAFELLDLMAVYKIHPSIIIFTNLIHTSFYNNKPNKAELAYKLLKKEKLRGDCLLYSKLIDGLIRFKEFSKIEKYIDLALEERLTINSKTQKLIRKIMKDNESIEYKLKQIEKNKYQGESQKIQKDYQRIKKVSLAQ